MLLAAALLCAASASEAATPTLLRNLYTAPPAELGSDPSLLATLAGGRAVFAASDPRHGHEPWVTDGTAAGTRLLGDLVPGPEDSLVPASWVATTGERVFFLAGSLHVKDLWVTDGTSAGTQRLLAGVRTWSVGPSLQADGAGRAFLLGLDSRGEGGLWVSDGSVDGTRRLPLPTLAGLQPGRFLGSMGSRVLFVAGSGIGGSQEVWASDGTAAGTQALLPGPEVGPHYDQLAGYGYQGSVFRVAVLDDGSAVVLQDVGIWSSPGTAAVALWHTDGTAAGTRREGLLPGRIFADVLTAARRAAFCLWDGADEPRLWWSDGSGAGTRAILPDSLVCPDNLRWGDDRLFFTHAEPLPGPELAYGLWIVEGDGEARRLADLPGSVASSLQPFAGGVAFLVEGSDREQAVWVSDGTEAGTRRLVRLGPRDGRNALLGAYDLAGRETLLLSLGQGETAYDLFAADLGDNTPRRLTDLAFPDEILGAYPGPGVLPAGGGVLFAIDDDVHGREPWLTDGTAAGTGLLANVSHAEGDGDSWPAGLTPYGDGFLFLARGTDGWGVWWSDGDGGGTGPRLLHRLAFDTPPDYEPQYYGPAALVLSGERFYFTVPTADPLRIDLKVADLAARQLRHLGRFPSAGNRTSALPMAGDALLWAPRYGEPLVFSDGTAAGTRAMALRGSPQNGGLASLPDGSAVVTAFKQEGGQTVEIGLWRTDGTPQGSRLLLATDPAPLPGELTAAGDGTVFFAYAGSDGAHPAAAGLWSTDGTAAGTRLVESFAGLFPGKMVNTDQGLFFFLEGAQHTELRLRPPGGAASMALLEETAQELRLSRSHWAVPFGRGILFAGTDSLFGTEPWVSDGTTVGTRRLGDLSPGTSGFPMPPVVGDAQAFFHEADRLWRTDGTPAGTFPAADDAAVRPYGEMAVLGQRLFFAGHSLETGRELWWLPTRGLVPPTVPTPPRPGAPAALRAISTPSAVRLEWPAAGGEVERYEVDVRTPGSAAFRLLQPVIAQTSLWVHGLPPEVPHVFRVRAVNAAGSSPPGPQATASILADRPTVCQPSDTVLCLLGDRFEVGVWWRDPRSGDFGRARAAPLPGTDLSGTFWFFQDSNVELIVKALDGTPVNRRWWLFAGGLTDVEYWLQAVDLEAVEKDPDHAVGWYHHSSRDLCGFADTDAFPGLPGRFFPLPSSHALEVESPLAYLDLLGGRYRVQVDWYDPRSGDSGAGHAIPHSDSTGFFWFFRDGNVELVVKVLDGTPVNGHHWFFYGGLTDVEYTLRVEDLAGGGERSYHHAAGDLCGGADTTAFAAPAP